MYVGVGCGERQAVAAQNIVVALVHAATVTVNIAGIAAVHLTWTFRGVRRPVWSRPAERISGPIVSPNNPDTTWSIGINTQRPALELVSGCSTQLQQALLIGRNACKPLAPLLFLGLGA